MAGMTNDQIIERARRQMDDAATSDRDNRERSQDDLRFLVGDQWPDDVKADREKDGKPCLTFNSLPQFTRRVTSQIRAMNPAVRVIPADGAASEDTAEIMSGMIRQIEYECDGSSVYERAGELAAACGIGWFRVRADYVDEMSFDQEAILESIHNPFSVFCDPQARNPDRSDAKHVFIAEDMLVEDFKEAYPKARVIDATTDHHMLGLSNWLHGERITVAEYYWIEEKEATIGLMRDGRVVENPVAALDIVKKRKTTVPAVKWAKITGAEVLEGPLDIPCRHIPVIAVTGEEWPLGEVLYRSSVIRFAKDAQQLYNMSRTANAEVIALQSKAPYLVTAKQVEGLEEIWAQANSANRPYLPYNADPLAPGRPQREMPPVPSQAHMAEIQLSAEDMKRTTGIYDASLGAKSNETSGVAIAQRQQEAEQANSVYADNTAKAVARCGRILVDMIPRIYDTMRIVRVLGEDGQEKLETINALVATPNGQMPFNHLNIGKYDVRLSIGPNYQTKKEQAAEDMGQFINAFPQAGQIIGDLYAKAQEWPDADRIAERLKKAVPPQFLDEEDQDQSPEAQAQRQQAMQAQAMQQEQQQRMADAALAKCEAEAEEARADAIRAVAEAEKAKFEAAQLSGQIDAALQDAFAQGRASAIAPMGMIQTN